MGRPAKHRTAEEQEKHRVEVKEKKNARERETRASRREEAQAQQVASNTSLTAPFTNLPTLSSSTYTNQPRPIAIRPRSARSNPRSAPNFTELRLRDIQPSILPEAYRPGTRSTSNVLLASTTAPCPPSPDPPIVPAPIQLSAEVRENGITLDLGLNNELPANEIPPNPPPHPPRCTPRSRRNPPPPPPPPPSSPPAAIVPTPIQSPPEVEDNTASVNASSAQLAIADGATNEPGTNQDGADDKSEANNNTPRNRRLRRSKRTRRTGRPARTPNSNPLVLSPDNGEETVEQDYLGSGAFQPLEDPYDDDDDNDDGEDHAIPVATPFTREKLVECLQLNGCQCTGASRSNQRIAENCQDGLSISDTCRTLAPHTIDVMRHVTAKKQLPQGLCSPRSSHHLTSGDWRKILAGLDETDDSERIKMSLEKSCLIKRSRPVNLRRWWDIDAFFLPLHSLDAHKWGFKIAYYPRITRVLSQDWRIRIGPSRIRNLRCKSLYLGHGWEGQDFRTYIFFPNAFVSNANNRRGVTLSKEEHQVWLNEVLFPALSEVYSSDVLQQHPKSFDDAYHRAHARQQESVSAGEKTVAEHHYDLPSYMNRHDVPALSRLWDAIRHQLSLLGPEWHNAQLITSTYNCKLQYREHTVDNLREQVDAHLAQYFHIPDVDFRHAYVDLAYEDRASLVKPDGTTEALILLRRTCCNEATFEKLGLTRRSQLYHWQGTADASSIRAMPAWKSALRAGGIAYVQLYNTIKNMFTSTDRSTGATFGEPAFRSLAYSQASLDTFREMARQPQGARDPHKRQRALQAFQAVIARTHAVIAAHENSGYYGYSDRGEIRICWDLFQTLEVPQDQPSLEPSTNAHWPFYALSVRDVMLYLRVNTNRWLSAICGVLDHPGQEMEEQHRSACMLSALFECLELSLSSGHVRRLSRLAQDRYERKGAPPANPITIGGGTIRIGEEGDIDDEDALDVDALDADTIRPDAEPAADEHAPSIVDQPTQQPAENALRQRGLGLLKSLRATNLAWLPDDMFDWVLLRFDPVQLGKTAFMTGHFDSQFKWRGSYTQEEAMRRFVDRHIASIPHLNRDENSDDSTASIEEERQWIESCRPLYELIFFRYSHWLLNQLSKGRLRLIDDLDSDEQWGCYGLNYSLIVAATDHEPWITRPLADGSRRRNEGGGFRNFPSNWVTRIQLLFDLGDKFHRKTWDKLPFREWTRHIHRRLAASINEEWADAWKENIGFMGQTYLTILPAYESSKMYTFAIPPSNLYWTDDESDMEEKAIQWIAAVPWQAPRWEEIQTFPNKWRMMVQGKKNKVPNYLPALLFDHPEWMSGRRFDLIEDVMSAGRKRQVAPATAVQDGTNEVRNEVDDI